jgi:hypothetical protein
VRGRAPTFNGPWHELSATKVDAAVQELAARYYSEVGCRFTSYAADSNRRVQYAWTLDVEIDDGLIHFRRVRPRIVFVPC